MKNASILFGLIASLAIGVAGCTTSHLQPTAGAGKHKARPVYICGSQTAAPSAEGIEVQWSKTDPEPHTIFGDPVYNKHNDKHNIELQYSAFTVYYDDVILSPRWTAIKITKEIADKNKDIERLKRFKADPQLQKKGYKTAVHDDYKNPTGMKKWARGHMVQFDDARGYGRQAADDSFYTTNICPQLAALNGQGWLSLEKLCTEYARDYDVVWVYTGPIYTEITPFAPDRKIPSPTAFYKVAVRPCENNGLSVLAFIVPHESLQSNANLSEFLTSVDEVEKQTGLDFLHKLPDEIEIYLEGNVWQLWPDIEN